MPTGCCIFDAKSGAGNALKLYNWQFPFCTYHPNRELLVRYIEIKAYVLAKQRMPRSWGAGVRKMFVNTEAEATQPNPSWLSPCTGCVYMYFYIYICLFVKSFNQNKSRWAVWAEILKCRPQGPQDLVAHTTKNGIIIRTNIGRIHNNNTNRFIDRIHRQKQ